MPHAHPDRTEVDHFFERRFKHYFEAVAAIQRDMAIKYIKYGVYLILFFWAGNALKFRSPIWSIVQLAGLGFAFNWIRNHPNLQPKAPKGANANLFKGQAIPELVGFYHPDLTYSFEAPVMTDEIRDSHLFSKQFEFVRTQDCVASTLGPCQFAYMVLEGGHYENQRRMDQVRKKRTTVKVPVLDFKGLVLVADCPAAGEGWVTFHSKNLGSGFSRLASFLRQLGDGGERVSVMDPDLAACFDVRASSAHQAEVLLNSGMALKIRALAETQEKGLMISFFNRMILVVLPGGEGFLQHQLGDEKKWRELTYKYLEELSVPIMVLDVLGLAETSPSKALKRSA